ncbi:F-box protein [Trifolium pratense]|uniref:F-box protein n=1 Tax=Trifolium pratense TaxID=57577 RepID=A0A2K3MNW5_TRIPR|nr:F-box protein [Trifolium pratense]
MSLLDDFDYEPIFCGLWVFGDFLSLRTMGDVIVEIRVMKEFNVQSSWTKTLVLPIDGIPSQLLCRTKSGDIVGADGGTGLVKYDDKGQLLERHSYGIGRSGSQVTMYTESLLSPLVS